MELTDYEKKLDDALQTLEFLRDEELPCRYSENGFDEFEEEEWEYATEIAIDAFCDDFDDCNDWIFEDDYNSEEEFEEAKKSFCENVVNRFKEK